MSLAGVRRVWEELSPKKNVTKKQKSEVPITTGPENINIMNIPTSSTQLASTGQDSQMLSEIHSLIVKVSQAQDKHVVDMRAVIKEEITSLKSEFTEKIDLLEGKLREKDQRIEKLESKIHALENKGPAEETNSQYTHFGTQVHQQSFATHQYGVLHPIYQHQPPK